MIRSRRAADHVDLVFCVAAWAAKNCGGRRDDWVGEAYLALERGLAALPEPPPPHATAYLIASCRWKLKTEWLRQMGYRGPKRRIVPLFEEVGHVLPDTAWIDRDWVNAAVDAVLAARGRTWACRRAQSEWILRRLANGDSVRLVAMAEGMGGPAVQKIWERHRHQLRDRLRALAGIDEAPPHRRDRNTRILRRLANGDSVRLIAMVEGMGASAVRKIRDRHQSVVQDRQGRYTHTQRRRTCAGA